MKKTSCFIYRFSIFLLGIAAFLNLSAQGVAINSTTTAPDSSAMLDVSSTTKGILIPRMTTAQRTAINAPATGLLVFDNTTNGFWFYNGSAWTELTGVETDPQVASTTNNYLSKWNGTSLVDGSIYDDNATVGIGTGASYDYGSNFAYPKLAIISESNSVTDLNNILVSDDGFSPWINWGKARGTVSSMTSVQNNDQLFFLTANGHDGTEFVESGSIEIKVDGTVTTGSVPSQIEFKTTEVGNSSPSKRLIINNDGCIGIGNNSPKNQLDIVTNRDSINGIYAYSLTNTDGIGWDANQNYNAIAGSGGNAQYQAAIYGYVHGSANNTAAVLGYWDSEAWGALGYRDNNGDNWGAYINGDLYVGTKVKSTYIQMTNGAADGYYLQSDASGNASWVSHTDAIAYVGTSYLGQTSGNGSTGTSEGTSSNLNNLYIGNHAGNTNTTANENVGLGEYALANVTTGGGNVAIGRYAGSIIMTGTKNTAIGYNSGVLANGISNATAIGTHAIAGADNTLILGGTGSYAINVGIGTSSPANILDIQTNTSATASIQSSGSSAYLHNIAPVGNEAAIKLSTYSSGSTSTRWLFGKSTASESGSNAGSNFFVNRYNDAGTYLNQPFVIHRSTGYVGVGNSPSTNLNSSFEIDGSFGAKCKTSLVAGTTNPDATAMIWRYSSGTGTISLPAASGCTNRVYVIINQTGSSRIISTYKDLSNANQTTLANNIAIWIMSDGTDWFQIK